MPNNLTDYEENRLLDLSVVSGDFVALMTVIGTDSSAGTEVVGGGYGRASAAFGAASGSNKASSTAHVFMNMPAVDLQGWAIFSAATAGNRKWYGLFQPRVGTAAASSDTITAAGHGLADGAKVVFQTGYSSGGTNPATSYYVVGSTTDTFQVAASLGGAALDLTTDTQVVFGDVLSINAGEVLAIPGGTLVLSLS